MASRVGSIPWHDVLIKRLKKDPLEAAMYLTVALEDEDPRMFLMALRNVADAYGGITRIAKSTRLNRESLYRMLSDEGNPSIQSLTAVLRAIGFRLAVEHEKPKRRSRRKAA
jgi:probable addiction module antidote protein